ncbi:MAG: hypothetical protein JWN50_168 [Parcubacteria group bacterium]|nr:hypothetical protein [Parcubacteria group bacterium]
MNKEILQLLVEQMDLLSKIEERNADYVALCALQDLNKHRDTEHTLGLLFVNAAGMLERRAAIAEELGAFRKKFQEGQRELRKSLLELS